MLVLDFIWKQMDEVVLLAQKTQKLVPHLTTCQITFRALRVRTEGRNMNYILLCCERETYFFTLW